MTTPSMNIDISRDFLDGIMLQHPTAAKDGSNEIKAAGQLHFLPSSPDGTMHTAVVAFQLALGDQQPFARGGWRFLFTSESAFKPADNQNHPFFANLLVLGAGKLMAQFNNLCMHAGLPLIPFEPSRMTMQAPPAAGAAPVAQQAQA